MYIVQYLFRDTCFLNLHGLVIILFSPSISLPALHGALRYSPLSTPDPPWRVFRDDADSDLLPVRGGVWVVWEGETGEAAGEMEIRDGICI